MIRAATLVRLMTATILCAGVVCQFVQRTDPRFPLLYFTVDSAVLAAVVAAVGVVRSRPEPRAIALLRGCAAVGVVFSGLTFAAVIAPASATGTWFQPWDDVWVRSATILMHGLGPVLVTTEFVLHAFPKWPPWRVAALWCGWPISYAAVLVWLQWASVTQLPYPFLQPSAMGGWLPILCIGAAILAIYIGLGRVLLMLHGYRHRTVDDLNSQAPDAQNIGLRTPHT